MNSKNCAHVLPLVAGHEAVGPRPESQTRAPLAAARPGNDDDDDDEDDNDDDDDDDDDDSLAHQAQEFSKRLQRLRDAAEVHKYEGSAKEVFSICLDLQALLTVFKNSEEEYELIV